jgi:uncharacterized coiled-coil DUF342 family protein
MEAEQVYERLWREAIQEIDALKEERGELKCEITQLHAQISSIRAAARTAMCSSKVPERR